MYTAGGAVGLTVETGIVGTMQYCEELVAEFP